MRLAWTAAALALAVTLSWWILGARFEAFLTPASAAEELRALGSAGGWALFALLVLDLFLPVPATPLMSAGGYVYGALAGGALAAAGSIASGALAYGLCRALGHGAAERLVGARELDRSTELFARHGAWLVAVSRWMPVLPEVLACLAGLARMDARRFFVALVCGSAPMGFAYAWIGALGVERPALAIAASVALPAA